MDPFDTNRKMWDERAPAHAASPGYSTARLIADPTALSGVVAFDKPRLGELTGLDVLHLQCHIGTDTLSLARLGARLTGLDFSKPALDEARALARAVGADITYVHADAYAAADVLGEKRFDLVYTGIGALCWLPSIERWASVIARLLRPGGRLFLREGHPTLWALDQERPDGLLALRYPYFEQSEPVRFESPGTYVPTEAEFRENVSYEWNHGIGEIVTALLGEGFRLTMLTEHDSVPWAPFAGRMREIAGGEYQLIEGSEMLPLSYTLQAVLEG